MTITNGYATLDELQGYTGAVYVQKQAVNAEMAIEAASRQIDQICHQFFYDTGTTAVRTFRTRLCDRTYVDPFSTTTALTIATDTGEDGLFATEWAVTDYDLGRFGGDMADSLGAPYDTIYAIGDYDFLSEEYRYRRRHTLQVTARWGWAAIPTAVKRACVVLAAEMMQDPVTPFGVAGFDQFGAVRVRANPRVTTALEPYIRFDRAGIA